MCSARITRRITDMKRAKMGKVGLLMGVFFLVCVIAMFIHDANYIFTGKTVDLNEIIRNNEDLPRDKYVTYTCEVPLDAYGYSQDRYGGIIPAGRKSYNYAVIDDSGAIISVKMNNKKLMEEFEAAAANDGTVDVKGCFVINSAEMDRYLEDYCGDMADGEDIFLTSYVIDTTKTRLSLIVLYTGGLLIGIACIVMYVKGRTRR